MRMVHRFLAWQHLVVLGMLGVGAGPTAHAYIAMPPITLVHMTTWSVYSMLERVER
jgi:hypothetical protein